MSGPKWADLFGIDPNYPSATDERQDVPVPNAPRPENRHRMIRVEDELWDAAKTKAADLGTTVSEVVREALRRFVAS